jgi:hypothetical protein
MLVWEIRQPWESRPGHLPPSLQATVLTIPWLTLPRKRAKAYGPHNETGDISSLVENSGISAGDVINLRGNPLSPTSVDVHIPELSEEE